MSTSRCLALAIAATAVLSARSFASPTGLNNIPTADTPADGEGVFQLYGNFPDHGKAAHWAGFKTGLQPFGPSHRFESGVDYSLETGASGPLVFQFKYSLQPRQDLPAFALGAANLALIPDHRDEVGQPFSFAVISHQFPYFRVHLGYGVQHANDSPLFGSDKTVRFLQRDLVLRTDLRTIDGGGRWLGSAGFLYLLHESVALESWVSPIVEAPLPSP